MTNTSLKITLAGIRGKIGESLIPEVALDFAEIFGTLTNGGKIVLGTDTRVSTQIIKSAIISGLLSTGCDIVDIGVVSTPTVQIMVKELNADGGIMVTASHNPIMWNGIKFISNQGMFLDESEMKHMFKLYSLKKQNKTKFSTIEEFIANTDICYEKIEKIGTYNIYDKAAEIHIDKILKYIDLSLIKSLGLKVVIDCCNGSGAVMNPILMKKMGIETIYLNVEPNGKFNRDPEPVPQNLSGLSEAVVSNKADIGFAQDADADRLAIVDEKGNPIGEDYTLVLTMKYLLGRHSNPKGKVVATNLSTTRAFDDVANKFGAKVIHTKIGEINVSKALFENDSIVGGEGNGGVIIPGIGFGRDSFAGMAFMLEYLAASRKTVSELVDTVPKYKVVKRKKNIEQSTDINLLLKKVKELYYNEKIDCNDGVKVIFKDSWLHVRSSNTEPIIRYFAEAKTTKEATRLINSVY